jgi:hypothetical protein
MHCGTKMAVVALMLAVVHPVVAQNEISPEALAAVQPGERVALNRNTIARYGTQTRFEVMITWDDAGGTPPATHRPRAVRYLADCPSGKLTLVAVQVFDTTGRLVKTLFLPPGEVDPITPVAQSQEQKWLKEGCAN